MAGPGSQGNSNNQNSNYTHKHITVALDGQHPVSVNGNFSTRLVLNVVDESGEMVTGFFTADTTIDGEQAFQSELAQKQTEFRKGNPGNEKFEKIFILGDRVLERRNSLDFLYSVVNRKIDFNGKKLALYELLDTKNSDAFDMNMDAVERLLREAYDISHEEYPYSFSEDVTVKGYVLDLLSLVHHTKNDVYNHENLHMQSEGTNINRRNTTTSDYAELLDLSELTAKSTSMTIVDTENDTLVHGSFMVKAKGLSLASLSPKTPGFENKKLEIAPEGMRQISNLQILDYLCANVDRHQRNMFYQVDTSDPDKVRITGVQGIDNDASFGDVAGDEQPVFLHLSLLDDIKYIDAKMAEKVLQLKPEDVENIIRRDGLSANEIDAAVKRLTLLQDKINAGRVQILSTDEDWKQLIDANQIGQRDLGNHTESDLFHYVEPPRGSVDDAPEKNIFSVVNNVVCAYNTAVSNGDEYPFHQDLEAETIRRAPTVKAINTTEQAGLDGHIEYFNQNVRSKIPKDIRHASFKPLAAKVDDLIGTMERYSAALAEESSSSFAARDKWVLLSDPQRNKLSEKLQSLKTDATDYIARNPGADNQDPYIHVAKNIAAYADFAQSALRTDATLAIQNQIRKLNNQARQTAAAENSAQNQLIAPEPAPVARRAVPEKIFKAPPRADTSITFAALNDRIDIMKGRSQQDYKNMINAFQAFGNVENTKNPRIKAENCRKLISLAQKYLDHKLADKKAAGLKENEKRRVQFARDLKKYAMAHQKAALAERKYDKQIAADIAVISASHQKYRDLVNKYRDSTADKAAAEKNILQAAVRFKEDLDTMLGIADQYESTSDIRAVCGNMLRSSISAFMQAYTECTKDSNDESVREMRDFFHSRQDDITRVIADAKKFNERAGIQRKKQEPVVMSGPVQSVSQK